MYGAIASDCSVACSADWWYSSCRTLLDGCTIATLVAMIRIFDRHFPGNVNTDLNSRLRVIFSYLSLSDIEAIRFLPISACKFAQVLRNSSNTSWILAKMSGSDSGVTPDVPWRVASSSGRRRRSRVVVVTRNSRSLRPVTSEKPEERLSAISLPNDARAMIRLASPSDSMARSRKRTAVTTRQTIAVSYTWRETKVWKSLERWGLAKMKVSSIFRQNRAQNCLSPSDVLWYHWHWGTWWWRSRLVTTRW